MISKGTILNGVYEIIENIGSGSGGIIYKAYHKRMQKHVAIKLIKDNIKGKFSLRSEVDMLKDLKNDYLPQVLDFIEDGDDVYTVMEYIDGSNFSQCINNGQTFTEKKVRKYALQLCEAVEYLHNHVPPIIHSDIKPSNIMLTSQDNICLIDFNISTMTTDGRASVIGGSQGFAAPEQYKRIIDAPTMIDDFHEETRFFDDDETKALIDNGAFTSSTLVENVAYIDTRTDIYGVGASLYYMLTLRTPINGFFDFRGIKCSPELRNIILTATNRDPANRYKSISDMKKALSREKKQLPILKYAIMAAILVMTLAVGIAIGSGKIFTKNDKTNTKNNVKNYNTYSGINSSDTTEKLEFANAEAKDIYVAFAAAMTQMGIAGVSIDKDEFYNTTSGDCYIPIIGFEDTLESYLGNHFTGYYYVSVDPELYAVNYALWSETPIYDTDQLSSLDQELIALSYDYVGCYPLKE